MKILVTGGAGFIGSHLVDKLIEAGDKVVVIDNLSTGKKENLNPKVLNSENGSRFYQEDIRDAQVLRKIFAKEKFDLVSHQAANASVPKSIKDPIYDAEVNVLGSINIFKCALDFKVKKVVFASTGGALYGDARVIPTPEDYPTFPVSPYGVAKLAAERYLYCINKIFKLPHVILRYSNVYGSRQDPFGEAGVVAIFCQRIASNEQPIINGDGKQTRDYVYVDDVVRANILALKSNVKSGYFNVSTARETCVNDLFEMLVKISKKKVKEVHGPAKPEQRRSCLDYSKIKKELSWQPRISLRQGLKATYKWFLNKVV